MAYNLEEFTERYVDTPLTNFPVKEDIFDRRSDITTVLLPLVNDYNQYISENNLVEANQLLASNPDLLNCFFNAEKYNRLRDAIIAMQRHQIENCDTLFNTIAQKAGGINDNPEPEQASLVSYSAEKVDNLVNKFHTRLIVTIPASGWSDSYPYTNVVQIPGVTKNMNFQVIGLQHQNNPSYSQVKLDKKNMGMLMGNKAGVGDGSITFHAYKKPTADFTIVVEGG